MNTNSQFSYIVWKKTKGLDSFSLPLFSCDVQNDFVNYLHFACTQDCVWAVVRRASFVWQLRSSLVSDSQCHICHPSECRVLIFSFLHKDIYMPSDFVTNRSILDLFTHTWNVFFAEAIHISAPPMLLNKVNSNLCCKMFYLLSLVSVNFLPN